MPSLYLSPVFWCMGGGVLVDDYGLLEPPRIPQGQAEAVHRRGLALPVTETLSGAQADGGDGELVVEPAPPVKVLA